MMISMNLVFDCILDGFNNYGTYCTEALVRKSK